MKTKLICLFLFSSLLAYSQGILSCEEDASKAAIYTDGDRNTIHAMVEIECSASIPLTFKSKRLGSLTPSVIENGVITNYRITVNRNRRFRKDELHITSPHYRTLIIPLESVKRKEKKHFWVYDPDMEIAYLNYEEDVSKVAVFIDGDENSMNAMVEIECSTSIPLTFSSKYFGRLLPDTVVITDGETTNYKIRINTNPRHIYVDELCIMNSQYKTLIIPLKSVKRKEKKYFRVYGTSQTWKEKE